MTWIITPFSTNRLLKRDIGHWQKRSCVMGVLCQLLLTITPDLSVTEGYKKTLKKQKSFFYIPRKICNQKHPTGLHGYASKRRGRSNSATTSAAAAFGESSVPIVSKFAEMGMKCASAGIPAKIISMCVVSVKIGHVATKKEVSTLAMLDNCSQGTLMKESIKKKLGISGRKTEITIKTVNGKQKYRVSCGDWVKGFQKCSW